MKSRHISILVLALVLVAAMPVYADTDVTVGRFIQELARVKNLNATDVRIAVDSLRSVGVRMPEGIKLDQKLTEGDVVEISRAVGLRVSTNNPDSLFTEDQVNSYFKAFSVELGVIGGDDDQEGNTRVPSFDPHSKGKAYAKGHRTTEEPP
jgi:hypothetical protein